MFLERYTDRDLKVLNIEDQTADNLLVVVERSAWEVEFGFENTWIVVKDTVTNKHYRIFFDRHAYDSNINSYTVYRNINEVVEKEVVTKYWKDLKEC